MFFSIQSPTTKQFQIPQRHTDIQEDALVSVVVVCLVLHFHLVGEGDEAVGKAPGDEELLLVLSGELHPYPLGILGRALANVHRHIEDAALGAADDLSLAHGILLIVQPPQDALPGGI